MGSSKKPAQRSKANKSIIISAGIAILAIVAVFVIKGGSGADKSVQGGDITIVKNEVTQTAKFIPYKAGSTKMEVIAIKAPDGTVRTAFNTCQVCYNSGRGYYVQEGDELVCQNCGNRFNASQVEVIKGGCNPVPIAAENKTDDGSKITISQAFLQQNKALFGRWKK